MSEKRLESVDDCRMLAHRLAEEAKALGARAVIVIVSVDDPKNPGVHSFYGYEHRGPCLDLDGLARRITQATDANWVHRLSEQEKK